MCPCLCAWCVCACGLCKSAYIGELSTSTPRILCAWAPVAWLLIAHVDGARQLLSHRIESLHIRLRFLTVDSEGHYVLEARMAKRSLVCGTQDKRGGGSRRVCLHFATQAQHARATSSTAAPPASAPANAPRLTCVRAAIRARMHAARRTCAQRDAQRHQRSPGATPGNLASARSDTYDELCTSTFSLGRLGTLLPLTHWQAPGPTHHVLFHRSVERIADGRTESQKLGGCHDAHGVPACAHVCVRGLVREQSGGGIGIGAGARAGAGCTAHLPTSSAPVLQKPSR